VEFSKSSLARIHVDKVDRTLSAGTNLTLN